MSPLQVLEGALDAVAQITEYDHLISLAAVASAPTSKFFVSHAKRFNDVVGSTKADKWMNAVWGAGHRMKRGPSLSDLLKVYEQFGFEGVHHWLEHIGTDFCTPYGIPLPFADEICQRFGLRMMDYID